MRRIGIAATVAGLVAALPAAGADGADWRLRGEVRARIEFLGNQYRAGLGGSDQALAFRTLLAVERETGFVAFGIELQDSRHELDDDGSFLSTSQVAAADVLQAYARLPLGHGAPGGSITLGRQTIDIGSRRQLERVEFANVILNYSGIHGQWRGERDAWHLVYVAPVAKLPNDFESLRHNRIEADREQWNRRVGALHWIRHDAWPQRIRGFRLEAYAYTLDEEDSRRFPTPNRHYVTPGVRMFLAPAAGRWDAEAEVAWRFGNRRATSRPDDLRPLRVRARTVHAHVGYSMDHRWRTRIGIDWDYATGDRDPSDDRFDQYERLFGARRTDLGNTGIHGPLTPANIDAPGVRIETHPGPDTDVRMAFKRARLAQASDAWVVARVRDVTGRSGRSIGLSTDLRVRHWLVRDAVRLEIGASYLDLGRFPRSAPNSTGEGDPRYGYAQVTWTF